MPFIPTLAYRETKMKVLKCLIVRGKIPKASVKRVVGTTLIGVYIRDWLLNLDIFLDSADLLIILILLLYSIFDIWSLPCRALSPMGSQCQ